MSAPRPPPPGGWPVLPERTLGWGGVGWGAAEEAGTVGKGRRGLSRRPPEPLCRQRGLVASPGAQVVPSRRGACFQVTP